MITHQLEADGKAIIRIKGRFTFSTHPAFRGASKRAIEHSTAGEIRVDLAQVDYVDSAALAMLLILRDQAIANNKTVSLCNARGVVRQFLDIANFHTLFDIQ